jgi:hypothetical protein
MYNLNIGGLEAAYGAQIQQLIPEIKRAMTNKRYHRCITERALEYGRRRLASNLIIVAKKLTSLLKYQGKKKTHWRPEETSFSSNCKKWVSNLCPPLPPHL